MKEKRRIVGNPETDRLPVAVVSPCQHQDVTLADLIFTRAKNEEWRALSDDFTYLLNRSADRRILSQR